MYTNRVFTHAFFEGLYYNARASEPFFNLLDKLSEGNQGYERDISWITTQKVVDILDVDQATTLNSKIGSMQHTMTLHFKPLASNQVSVNVVEQAANWCRVGGSWTRDT